MEQETSRRDEQLDRVKADLEETGERIYALLDTEQRREMNEYRLSLGLEPWGMGAGTRAAGVSDE